MRKTGFVAEASDPVCQIMKKKCRVMRKDSFGTAELQYKHIVSPCVRIAVNAVRSSLKSSLFNEL